jgi:hypothetical protein
MRYPINFGRLVWRNEVRKGLSVRIEEKLPIKKLYPYMHAVPDMVSSEENNPTIGNSLAYGLNTKYNSPVDQV